jgi:hypothetical protein
MSVGADSAAHAAQRIISHDERRGSLKIAPTTHLRGHDKVRRRTVDRACLLAWLVFAILAPAQFGPKLGIRQKSVNSFHCSPA